MKTILVPFTMAENGGSQLSFFRLAQLLKDEYHFKLWFFNDGPFVKKVEEAGFDYEIFDYANLRTPWGLMKLRSLLKKMGPDYIYLHSSRLIAYLARGLRIPCIEKINMTRRAGSGGWCRYPSLDRIFSNFNSKILVVSEAIKEQMMSRGVPEENIEFLYSFVHPERFNNSKHRVKTRHELKLSESHILVLNIGRLVPQKAQKDFVAMAALSSKENPRLRFLILGEGELEEELKSQVKELELDDCFSFSGFRDDIENIYQAADIVVHCAHWEPLANVLLESRAAGKAIVASDVDGSREALEDYPYYDLVPVADIKALSKKTLAWAHKVATLKTPELPEKFSPDGARKQFRSVFV
jgi:glycosyltransferase involved in cell wall biosynthesis